jgi:thiazolinyl imide reductase
MRPYRVIVCGTNYGRTYLQAASLSPQKFQVVGILARGSLRSIQVAETFQLPLFSSLDQIVEDIDMACVAVGSSAPDVMVGLLDRGIHVLAEHPQKVKAIEKALAMAEESGLCFHVNPHFSDLKAPRSFTLGCRNALRASELCFIQVLAADRALYGVLDLLRSSFGSLSTLALSSIVREDGFVVLNGTYGSTRIAIKLQTVRPGEGQLADGSTKYFTDIHITAVFAKGKLNLMSIAGPVVWVANLAQLDASDRLLTEVVQEAPANATEFARERTEANLTSMNRLVKHINTGRTPIGQTTEALLDIAEFWETVSDSCKKI